jgi:hypothetical protein
MKALANIVALCTFLPLFSCSGPDPSAIEYKPRVPSSSGGTPSSSGGSSGGTSADGGGTPTGDSGGGGTGDAGKDASTARPEPTTGTYASLKTMNPHKPVGGTEPTLDQNQACPTCHIGNPKKFVASGVVYVKSDRAARASDYEIWIVDNAGKRIKTNSAANGGFWFGVGSPGDPADIAFPAYVAVRSPDGKVAKMSDPILTGDCNGNGCHSTTPLNGL